MARRCKKCGRVVKAVQPFCDKDGCKKKPLPRCIYCNALYRPEKTQAKYGICPHSKAPGSQHDFGCDLSEVFA